MTRRRAGHKLPWWESDAKYKARGRRKAIQYNGEWNDECEEMNKNKRGRPFKFSHGMMAYISITKALLDISYRELEGFLDGCWGKGHEIPEFTTIWKRIGSRTPSCRQKIRYYKEIIRHIIACLLLRPGLVRNSSVPWGLCIIKNRSSVECWG